MNGVSFVPVKKVMQEIGLDFLNLLPDNEKQGIETYKTVQ